MKRVLLFAGLAVMAVQIGGMAAVAQEEEAEEETVCTQIRGDDTPEDTTDDVEACRLDTWFAAGSPPIGNLAAATGGTLPSWDTTEPEDSYTTGSGGAYVSFGPGSVNDPGNQTYEAAFAGTFTGPVDNMAVSMYISSPVYQAVGIGHPIDLQVTLDDEIIVPFGTEYDVPLSAVNDQYGLIKFAVTDVADALEAFELDLAPDAEHTIEIQLINWYYGDGNSVLLYDAAEFPSDLVFNIEANKLSPYLKIPVDA